MFGGSNKRTIPSRVVRIVKHSRLGRRKVSKTSAADQNN